LFQGGFEVIDDLPSENVGIGKVVGVLQAIVSEPEDVEAGLVVVDEFFVFVSTPAGYERAPPLLLSLQLNYRRSCSECLRMSSTSRWPSLIAMHVRRT
jgi:hypothetical protein